VTRACIANFPIGERYKVSFRWELFNAFNRANFGDPAVGTGVGQSGQISSAAPARIIAIVSEIRGAADQRCPLSIFNLVPAGLRTSMRRCIELTQAELSWR